MNLEKECEDYLNNCIKDDNYQLESTKKANEYKYCPHCGEKYNRASRSDPTNYYCKNGHTWVINHRKGEYYM